MDWLMMLYPHCSYGLYVCIDVDLVFVSLHTIYWQIKTYSHDDRINGVWAYVQSLYYKPEGKKERKE